MVFDLGVPLSGGWRMNPNADCNKELEKDKGKNIFI